MRIKYCLAACVVALCFVGPAHAQSWESARSTGMLNVGWSVEDDLYTFTLSNPANGGCRVLGWTLEPFNVPAPVWVDCPEGWVWESGTGWSQFRVDPKSQKYDQHGPALEPGEAISFLYRVGSDPKPVNPGGPQEGQPAFLSHVAAVGEVTSGKWVAADTERGRTWNDMLSVIPPKGFITEPVSAAGIISGFCVLGCLKLRRKWV